ncbi:MAG TPA: ABC transporter substrate-binding protein [Alphaproteobacteria bacterium]|nr:ABC transporter substrate-binding protein [Alphaproteobacteria bacterium]
MTISQKRFVSVLLLGLAAVPLFARAALVQSASAAESSDPAQFVQNLGNRAMAQLTGKEIPEQEERARFRQLLNESFDVPTIGRFTVGRSYWNSATPQQQQEFINLYEGQVVNAYAKRFQDYSGEQFKVQGEQKEGDGGDTVVNSQIVRPNGGPPVSVQWRVRQEQGGPKIVDVVIQGISMAVTDRNQFAAVIQRGGNGIQSLIDALKSQNVEVAQPPASGGGHS